MGAQHYTDEELKAMRREYNKIFTAFQELDEMVMNWTSLKESTRNKWDLLLKQQQLNALTEQITAMKEHGKEMANYTKSFQILTVALIIATLVNAAVAYRGPI